MAGARVGRRERSLVSAWIVVLVTTLLGVVPSVTLAAPVTPTNVAPSPGATGVATDPLLRVGTGASGGGPVTTTFYGRPAGQVGADDFTLVVIPDTQHYVDDADRSPTFAQQTRWIRDHVDDLDIVFVSHLGDLTESYDTSEIEFVRADEAMDVLDDAGVPNNIAPGNHDFSTPGALTSNLFDTWFPPSRYDLPQNPWYGGWLGEEDGQVERHNKDNYELFSAGGIDFLIIHLEVDMPTYAVAWADTIIDRYPDRQVIISTHAFLTTGNVRGTSKATSRSDGLTAAQVWTQLISPNCNVFMVVSGHYHGEGRLTSTNACGRPVHQVLTDYQARVNGGDGWLRYYTFRPAAGMIDARTYSPKLGTFEVDATSQFSLSWDMSSRAGFTRIAAVETTGGAVAAMAWPGRAAGATYEWYAVSSDGVEERRSPTWTFTTTDGSTPTPTPTATATATPTATPTASPSATPTASPTATPTTPPAGGGISLRSVSYGSNQAVVSSINAARPAGVQAGDVLLASIDTRGSSTVATPAGWTLLRMDINGTSLRKSTYLRVAGAAEPATYTWTFSGNRLAAAVIHAYRGVDPANPVDAVGGLINARATSVTAPSVTTTVADTMLVAFFAKQSSGTWTPPPGMIERGEINGTAGSLTTSASAADAIRTATGPTGTRVATTSVAANSVAHLVALRPGGSGGSTPTPTPTATATATPTATPTASPSATPTASPTATPTTPPAGGGISLRSVSYGSNQAVVSSINAARPAGVQAGDVLLASIDTRGSSSVATPAGWTLLRMDINGTSLRKSTYLRVAGAAEPATYTWTFSGNRLAAAVIHAYRGVDPANPVDAVGGLINARATSVTAPSVTTTVTDTMLVAFFAKQSSGTWTPPPGMTERGEINGTGGSLTTSASGADAIRTATGPTGTRVATTSVAANSVAHLVALRPAAAP